jgi:hypothetical protein
MRTRTAGQSTSPTLTAPADADGADLHGFHLVDGPTPWPAAEPEDVVLFGRWTKPAHEGFGDHYVHPPRARRRPWAVRPWQKMSAPVTRRRVKAERLHPMDGAGVTVRCLVCLVPPGRLRYDQVCDACDQHWRKRAGRPWGEDFDRFVAARRVAQAKKSTEHLAAYGRAADYLKFDRPPLAEITPLTRGTTPVSFDGWETGVVANTSLACFF